MFVLRSLNALLFAALFSSSALAQVAIGYLDLNAILSQYPDMNQANAELASYEEKLGGDIRVFQDYLNSQIQAYVEKQKTGLSDFEKSKYEEVLERLNTEYQERITLAQQDLVRKRGELMSPVIFGIDKALRELAASKNLDCVIQRENEARIPVLVFAPENANLTVEVLKHLGWRLTEEQKTALPFNVDPGNTSIGFTNVELVLANMPAIKSMEVVLAAYQKKLTRDFESKQATQLALVNDYNDKRENERPTDDEMKQMARMEKEILKLNNEIRQFPQFADALLQERRIKLMEPELNTLQSAIDKIAADNGFSFILNQTMSTGVTSIVHGPENGDITAELYKALNIPGAKSSLALSSPKNIKVGYLNVEKVFTGLPGVKEANAQLQEKFQKAIDTIAVEEGYTFMLNQTSASNILYMNPDHDETQNVLGRLKN
ncbi:MAG: OmpH family outer membrane protein [Candidatus Latescibacteria bacterium]|nr:OmpH family outer membrane protein [Candidatus Latescibacterota bacterium]MDP7236056.1 OmpH family outer membrane protein [Candidatus Latescibacterota bacterium]